jgi:hypothetical protein
MTEEFDKVTWEWLCSLHPRKDDEVKQHDPVQKHCQCGRVYYLSKFDYIKMILFDKLIITCPRCHRKHQFKLCYHAIEEFNETRKQNNELEQSKLDLWCNS